MRASLIAKASTSRGDDTCFLQSDPRSISGVVASEKIQPCPAAPDSTFQAPSVLQRIRSGDNCWKFDRGCGWIDGAIGAG